MSLDDRLNVAAQLVDSQFLPGSSVQYAWDSVSITSMLACPRRYQYQIIDGLHPKNPSYAIALVFGILFHKGLEHYHRARLEHTHEEATHHAISQIIADPATATLPTDDGVDRLAESHDPDEDDGITLRNSKIRTRYYLIRALVWYLDQYANDPMETIQLPTRPAVELSFRIPMPINIAGTELLLCGHIDRMVTFNGLPYVMDYKTTKSLTRQWFDGWELSHQMSGYTVAGQIIHENPVRGAVICGTALQVGQVKFGRGFTNRSPGQIREYMTTLRYVSEQAQRHADSGEYPMNTSSCYFCEFKEICKQPPEYRDRYINQHYDRKVGWNPLENR